LQQLPTSFGKQKKSPSQAKSKQNEQSSSPESKNKIKVDFSEDFISDHEDDDNDNDTHPSNPKPNANPDKNTSTDTQTKSDKQFERNTKKYFEHIIKEYQIPIKYVAKLKGHRKLISTMSIDKSGTRLITGSYDNTVKLWDFGGMNESLNHFREIIPCEGYPIKSLAFNHTGSMFLCCTASHKPMIYDRDGRQLMVFNQGDMYIRDMNHTFGHTMPLMGGNWFGYNYLHCNVNEIATWSQDSTFRIWDVETSEASKNCKQIIKARNKSGKRISITSADYNQGIHDSFLIVLGTNDGSLQLFDHKSHCQRPTKVIGNAHTKGTDVSCVMFDKSQSNSHCFVTRGGFNDNTMKVWDTRNLSHSQPLKSFDSMWNITSLCNVIESPDRKMYVTLCSNQKDEAIGKSVLCFIDKKELMEMIRIPISEKPINTVLWHSKINQMFIGGNDSNVRVFYEDAPRSKNGVLLCAKRKYKKKHIDEQMKYFRIINPNALRVYKRHSQILADKRRKDLLLHKPQEPHYGIGVAGRINTESFSAHVYASQEKNVMSQVDPRDRLLLFDEKAKQQQQFTAIYNINQPQPIFQENDEQDIEANNIVNQLYSDMPGSKQYNPMLSAKDDDNEQEQTQQQQAPPHKKQKT